MAFNPMDMMKLGERFRIFQSDHPRVVAFLQSARGYVREGTVIEMSITTPEGTKKTTNMRINANDVETLQTLMNVHQ